MGVRPNTCDRKTEHFLLREDLRFLDKSLGNEAALRPKISTKGSFFH
jgi:hypothetical protein